MFRYFTRNRHGAISVMLAIVLTAVLSMGSTLMEVARYRSLERLYKEIEENAAFSVLAHYDRDLYENFGLLGIQQDVGEEELLRYLEQNLMGLGSSMNFSNADILSSGMGEVGLDKLYDLSQEDVFRSQIAEFSAYRAPISIINNSLDIEASLKELNDKLEETLPVLTLFKNISTAADTCLDTIIKLQEYVESSMACNTAMSAYGDKVNSYNAAVSELDSYKGEHDSSEEGYEEALEGYRNSVAENAADLREKITDLTEALKDLDEKQAAYAESFQAMMGANMKSFFSAARDDANNIKDEKIKKESLELIEDMEDGYDEGEKTLKGLYDKLEEKLSGIQFEGVIADLEAQSNKLSGPPDDLEETEALSLALAVATNPIWFVMDLTIATGTELMESINSMTNAIEQIKECAGLIGLTVTGGVFDPNMNHSITPPYASLNTTSNPYAAEDALRVDRQIEETNRVADSIGFDPTLMQAGETWEMMALYNAMQNLQMAEADFRNACQNLSASSGLISMLTAIKDIVISIISFLDNLTEVIGIFSKQVVGNLERMVYQKLYASVYATEMFSNRITDKDDDKRLNGSSFFGTTDLADAGRCFSQADAEYIFCGSNNEILNQTDVFLSMLTMRMLCNIPTVFTDKEFINVLSELAAVPVLGWIVDVLLVLTRIYAEAWADMIFMIYAKEEVDIIKLEGYFDWSGKGLEELESKMKSLINEQAGHLTDMPDESDDDSNFAQDYVDGLFEWGYKDHLFVLMLIFTPSRDIYLRSANLIELELQQKKAKDGVAQAFKLDEMATYIRVEMEAKYTPLLPVPEIPGLNQNGLGITTMHYSGY